MLCRPRKDIGKIVANCTGYFSIGKHAARLGILFNICCRSCANLQEKETVLYLLCLYPAPGKNQIKMSGKGILFKPRGSIRDLIPFISSANWF